MLTVVFSIVGILGIQTPPTQAKRIINKVKLLENGKTYSYDINGDGKKESILVKVVETYSNKINELEERVHQLENASQS